MKKNLLYPIDGRIVFLGAALALGAFGYGWFQYDALSNLLVHTQEELASTTAKLEGVIDNLERALASTTNEKIYLSDILTIEKARNSDFQNQINQISTTVGTLDKLSKTDSELLQKYSKVYFLNEHYVPEALTDIDTAYLYNKKNPQQAHSKVKPLLEAMLQAARADKIELYVTSAYRSYATQAVVKANHTFIYGAGTANQFSADQGYSEHQLGTTVDLTSPDVPAVLEGFDKSVAYPWLLKNAHRFGFTLSYPKGNAYYQFEPWHWRYVGIDLASRLHTESKHFYDLEQRDINQYLIKIFD